MAIRTFTQLNTWQQGHKFVLLIYEITGKFPNSEKFGLVNQMRRAAVSVTSNIAEGFCRNSRKEKIQFYRTSLGSLTEIQNQLIIAKDLALIKYEDFEKAFEQSVTVSKLINGLIKSAASFSR